ncbi:hypothetical protein ELS64_21070, partial [Shigella sonnei]|nr:hypothetical protein [Shigella sonnei]EGD8170803.1 hypothetical protein [Shigella sonnei]
MFNTKDMRLGIGLHL